MHAVLAVLCALLGVLIFHVATLRRERREDRARLAGLAAIVPQIWGSLRAIDTDLRALEQAVLVPTPRCDRLHVADLTARREAQPLGDEPLCVEDLPGFRGPLRPYVDDEEQVNPLIQRR